MIGALELIATQLAASANYVQTAFELLSKDAPYVRISEASHESFLATNLLEHDVAKLRQLEARGRESFAKHEGRLRQLLC